MLSSASLALGGVGWPCLLCLLCLTFSLVPADFVCYAFYSYNYTNKTNLISFVFLFDFNICFSVRKCKSNNKKKCKSKNKKICKRGRSWLLQAQGTGEARGLAKQTKYLVPETKSAEHTNTQSQHVIQIVNS